MTPKKEANNLIKEFQDIGIHIDFAKECAVICLNKLIQHSKSISMIYDLSFDESKNYYIKIKNELLIEKSKL
jgi:hypothetical protein